MTRAKSVVPWLFGAVLTFVIVSLAFLFLANLGTRSSETNLAPPNASQGGESPLRLSLDLDQLASLRGAAGQEVDVRVANGARRALSGVNLVLETSSEDTSRPAARFYRKTLKKLPPGSSVGVRFSVDLSRPKQSGDNPDPPREILEVRATTPDGVSAVRSVVLALRNPARSGPR